MDTYAISEDGVALLLPVTFGMDPATGLIVLGGIYCGAIFGGSISAILIHTPGTPASAATAIEGYQLTLRGKAAKDLSAFDLESLRWRRIIICTDADVDGFQIRTLILTMLYRLVPTLIEQGYVYIAESPLYEITCRDKSYFAFDESEKAAILKKLEGKKILIQRSKGLGENQPEMMWETTMNPENRRLIRITPDEAAATSEMFDLLLGDNLAGRKEYIAENGADYLELADIS